KALLPQIRRRVDEHVAHGALQRTGGAQTFRSAVSLAQIDENRRPRALVSRIGRRADGAVARDERHPLRRAAADDGDSHGMMMRGSSSGPLEPPEPFATSTKRNRSS